MSDLQIDKAEVRSYRDLIAWQKALSLAEQAYKLTSNFPNEEKFGLTSQMRRAAVSIASNLAEGHARNSRGEFMQFVGHAQGSLAELETQSLLSARLGYLASDAANRFSEQSQEVSRLLAGLKTSLKDGHRSK
jgi:four helix bundle protein